MADHVEVVSVERVIPASPEAIFDLIADPARHAEIDGSGTVRGTRGSTESLALGSKFGIAMKMGVPYSMINTVVEFERPRVIAWRPDMTVPFGARLGGRMWRYELESVEAGTRVHETWDITAQPLVTRLFMRGAAQRTKESMDATLARIEKILAP
jgi:uncharacterized protein YndB with AHSA1/START domain